MAKGGNHRQYTEYWFLSRGYTSDGKGGFVPPKFRNPLKEPENKELKIVAGKFTKESIAPFEKYKYPVNSNIKLLDEFELNKPLESVIVIDGLVAGLNGDKGLMRSHWSDTKKKKDLYKFIIGDHLRDNKARKHEGRITIQYIGYKSVLMDWDNFCSSFKHIGDSLVEKKIIKDDKPSIVIQFIPQQIKCKRDEQKVVIIIKDYA